MRKLEKSKSRFSPFDDRFFSSNDVSTIQICRELFSLSFEMSFDSECRSFAEKMAKSALEYVHFPDVFGIDFRRLLQNVSYFQQTLFSLWCIESACQIDVRKKSAVGL